MSNEVDIFEITQIDGFSAELTQRIISVIKQDLADFPTERLNLESLMERTGATFAQVEICCHAMLFSRLIKASFYPVHTICGHQIGQAEISVHRVQFKIVHGEYNGKCPNCKKDISMESIQIAMDFWNLGTDIKKNE